MDAPGLRASLNGHELAGKDENANASAPPNECTALATVQSVESTVTDKKDKRKTKARLVVMSEKSRFVIVVTPLAAIITP